MTLRSSEISYVTLGVTNFSVMQKFYSGLGFSIYKQNDTADHPYVMYKSTSVVLALYPKHLLALQSGCSITDFDNNAAMCLSLNVDSKVAVEKFLLVAKELGAEITREGFVPEWGGYSGYFRDPEKNLWEVVWHEKFIF